MFWHTREIRARCKGEPPHSTRGKNKVVWPRMRGSGRVNDNLFTAILSESKAYPCMWTCTHPRRPYLGGGGWVVDMLKYWMVLCTSPCIPMRKHSKAHACTVVFFVTPIDFHHLYIAYGLCVCAPATPQRICCRQCPRARQSRPLNTRVFSGAFSGARLPSFVRITMARRMIAWWYIVA